jgi:hypothetical protein
MAQKDNPMTNELKRRIAALRGINPRLNSVTDQVTEIMRSVEKTLVEELKIGIDASQWFLTEPTGELGVSREHHLSFDRVGSAGFRIHVSIVTVRDTSEETGTAGSRERLNEERVLWTSCSRELKLRAFEKLPELLESIIQNAESLLHTADLTATKIKEIIGDPEPITPPKDAAEKSKWFGRSRRRSYTIQEAALAYRQYFLDLGVSEAALGSMSSLGSLSSDGWAEDGRGGFVSLDGGGKVRCSVKFVDEEGTAEITFPDGESECVTIEEA